jgi:hypothetical protein
VAVRDGEEVSLGRHVGLERLCALEPEGEDWNSGCLPGAPVVVEGVAEEEEEEGGAEVALTGGAGCVELTWGVGGCGAGCGLP